MRGGVFAGSNDQSGSTLRIDASVSVTVSLPNPCRPARHSKSTQPNDQTSLRLSTVRPRACSGLM